MKKVILILSLSTLILSNVFSQCVEVKGVETRGTKYGAANNYSNFRDGVYADNWYEYGFTFTNLNEYTVTIEAELWEAQQDLKDQVIPAKIVQTKTFTIKAADDYLWKNGLEYGEKNNYGSITKHGNYSRYYVKFKVFKCP